MKYIKKFDTLSAQTEYLNSADIDTYVGYVDENETVYYDDAIPNYAEQYLTFDIISAGTINIKSDYTIYYSLDNGVTWSATDGTPMSVSAGDKVLWKGVTDNGYGTNIFSGSTATFNVEGNIMSLIYGDNFIGQTTLPPMAYSFAYLFMQLNVVSAENLILPATTLTEGCYYQMFIDCASLTTAPVLPATTLAENCYQRMFRGCWSLNYIKCLATDISASNCTYRWVTGVPSTGTFVKAASMNGWPNGDGGIPRDWTIENE